MEIKSFKSRIFWSTIILFVIGIIKQFVYVFTDESIFTALFNPVNESVWEHIKLVLTPIFFWWLIYYLMKRNKLPIDKNKWFLGCLVSMVLAIILIPSLHYFFINLTNMKSIIFDIILLYIVILISQFSGYFVFKYCKGINYIISLLISLILIAIFVILTFKTPQTPIFRDNETNTYGIKK